MSPMLLLSLFSSLACAVRCVSDFCPLDLFSGTTDRVSSAIRALIKTPQVCIEICSLADSTLTMCRTTSVSFLAILPRRRCSMWVAARCARLDSHLLSQIDIHDENVMRGTVCHMLAARHSEDVVAASATAKGASVSSAAAAAAAVGKDVSRTESKAAAVTATPTAACCSSSSVLEPLLAAAVCHPHTRSLLRRVALAQRSLDPLDIEAVHLAHAELQKRRRQQSRIDTSGGGSDASGDGKHQQQPATAESKADGKTQLCLKQFQRVGASDDDAKSDGDTAVCKSAKWLQQGVEDSLVLFRLCVLQVPNTLSLHAGC